MSPLAPVLLIAAPPLGDPNFACSVVLLVAHGPDGAFGWVINGREVMSLSELLVQTNVTPNPLCIPGSVRLGGPVSPEQVWLIYRSEDRLADVEGQFDVGLGITACTSRRLLERIAAGDALKGLLGLVGYAGWGPSQLENEIRVGAWLPTDIVPELVFDVPREDLWTRAYQQIGASPMAFATRTVGLA